jgi:peptidoglycan/xylan/chitin deacetylase (PgdA/CDA1 family)
MSSAEVQTADFRPRRRRRPPPGLPTAVLCAALLATAGCNHGPRSQGTHATATDAHSTAMAHDSHLDPPALADLPVVGHADGIPVLCYHYFRGSFAPGYTLRVLGSVLFGLPALGPREFWTTPAGEFERHLRLFRDDGIAVITLDEVADLVAAGNPLPRRAVVLTIDDADHSVYRHAFPLLRKYNARAHLFVPTAQVGRDWSGLRISDAAELKEMADSGLVLLDSHTHDLHYKLAADGGMQPAFLVPELIPVMRRPAISVAHPGRLATVARDLEASRDGLARLVGRREPWLAWPYGFASPALDSLANRVGFRGTVSLSPRPFGATDRDLRVGRYTLTAHTTLAQVAAIVR